MSLRDACRFHDTILRRQHDDLCSDLVLRSLARYGSPGLSPASGFEHLLVPSRLAFLQRSASGTICLRLS